MKNNAEDILKSVLTDISGAKDEVELRDVRKEKKRGRPLKNIVDSNPSLNSFGGQLEIVGGGAKSVGWETIKDIRKTVIKDNLSLWTSSDFYLYCKKKYQEKYNSPWNLKMGNAKIQICKLRDDIEEYFGFQSNLMIKDYIDYFFDNYMDFQRKRGKDFLFVMLRSDSPLKGFFNNYNYQDSFNKFMKNKKEEVFIKSAEIKASYDISPYSLVVSYGIVISVNWLLSNRDFDGKQAIQYVYKACKKLNQTGQLDLVKKSTEAFSPYPSACAFKIPNLILEKIKEGERVEVDFLDDDKINSRFKCIIKRKK